MTPQGGEYGDVILHAYRSDGALLDFAAFRDRQSNGAGESGYDDVLLNSESLTVAQFAPLEEAEEATAKLALPGAGPYTLALSWPTSHGYSALLADLPGPGTYDLTELAAPALHDRQAPYRMTPSSKRGKPPRKSWRVAMRSGWAPTRESPPPAAWSWRRRPS